ncbi:MAG: DUF5402 family protein [Candidatus Syntropharchaeia archaeon]
MITDRLLRARSELERGIKNLTGKNVIVKTIRIFSLSCGCTGLYGTTKGIDIADVEIFGDLLVPQIRKVSSDLGIDPGSISTQISPGTSEIRGIRSGNLCDRCQRELEGKGRIKGLPDVYSLYFEKKKFQPNEFAEKRVYLENDLRKATRIPITLSEFSVFGISCGCSGIDASVRGLRMEEAEKASPSLRKISKEIGIEGVVYARKRFGTPDVSGLTVRSLCGRCRIGDSVLILSKGI